MAGEKDFILSQCRQLLSFIPEDFKASLEVAISGLDAADEKSIEERPEFNLLTVLMQIASNAGIQNDDILISKLDRLIDTVTDYMQCRMRQNLHRVNLTIKRPGVPLPKDMEENRERLIQLIANQNPILAGIDTLMRRQASLKTQLKALNSTPRFATLKMLCCFSDCTQKPSAPISPTPRTRPRRSTLILETKEDKIIRELSEIRDQLNSLHQLLIDPLYQSRVFIRQMQEHISSQSKTSTSQLAFKL